MKNIKKGRRILISLGVGIALIIMFYFISNAITKYTGFSVSPRLERNDFESCLKRQDIVLYINTNSPAQSLRNNELLDYLDSVKIMNCLRNKGVCVERGVNSFPTWIINGEKIRGAISVSELSEFSGCKLV